MLSIDGLPVQIVKDRTGDWTPDLRLEFEIQHRDAPVGMHASMLLDHGADGDRTHDLRLAKPALSQLSYSPAVVAAPMGR